MKLAFLTVFLTKKYLSNSTDKIILSLISLILTSSTNVTYAPLMI